MKSEIQQVIRNSNKFFFKKNIPDKISFYFHEIEDIEYNAIKNLILFFKDLDYEFSTIDNFNSKLNSDKKLVSLTFDDGFKSWLRLIDLFDKYEIKSTFFINSIFFQEDDLSRFMNNINISDEKKLLDLSQFKEIINSGHEIGSHTHSHFTLSNLNYEDFTKEDIKNYNFLNQYYNVKSFAIPYGMRRYVTKQQLKYLSTKYETICFGEAGMQFKNKRGYIQRHPWKSNKSFFYNIENVSIDTSLFNGLTLRSGLG